MYMELLEFNDIVTVFIGHLRMCSVALMGFSI